MLIENLHAPKSPYHHLIGNNSNYNEIDKCIYLDGTIINVSFRYIDKFVNEIFNMFGFDVSHVLVYEAHTMKSRIKNMKWIRDLGDKSPSEIENELKSLQFYSTKRKTVEENWFPEIYLAISLGHRANSIFFSIRSCSDLVVCKRVFSEASKIASFCAGYVFDFPSILSSSAYYWGIVMQPAGRQVPRYGDRAARRLEICRDNTEIGILGSDGRRFYNVCDGYVRDVYPTMVLGECHRSREIDGKSLVNFLVESLPGSVEYVDSKLWLTIENEQLLRVQHVFDENKISLSGMRLDH